MKIYIFFKVGNQYTLDEHPSLYAWTTDKKIANEFKETRDMKKIFKEKDYSYDKSKIRYMEEKYSKQRLVSTSLPTKGSSVKMVMTIYEENSICLNSDNILINELAKHTSSYAKAFNPEYLEVLANLCYFDYCVFSNNDEACDDFYAGLIGRMGYPSNISIEPFPRADQLALFIYFYGYTMKVKN